MHRRRISKTGLELNRKEHGSAKVWRLENGCWLTCIGDALEHGQQLVAATTAGWCIHTEDGAPSRSLETGEFRGYSKQGEPIKATEQ